LLLNTLQIKLVLESHQIGVEHLVFLIDHLAQLFDLVEIDLVCQVFIQIFVDAIENTNKLHPVLLALVLSRLVLLRALLELLLELGIAPVQLLKPALVALNI